MSWCQTGLLLSEIINRVKLSEKGQPQDLVVAVEVTGDEEGEALETCSCSGSCYVVLGQQFEGFSLYGDGECGQGMDQTAVDGVSELCQSLHSANCLQ